MKLAKEEREADEKEKANMKELARANKLYNEKIAQEKRDARAREKEERDQLKAEKAKEVAERKAERESAKGKLAALKKLCKSPLQASARLHKKQHLERSRNVVLGMMWVVPRAWRVPQHLHTKPTIATIAAAKSFRQESFGERTRSKGL
jgi:hypothetical protein